VFWFRKGRGNFSKGILLIVVFSIWLECIEKINRVSLLFPFRGEMVLGRVKIPLFQRGKRGGGILSGLDVDATRVGGKKDSGRGGRWEKITQRGGVVQPG